MSLNIERCNKLVEALESGKYYQTVGSYGLFHLYDGSQYCFTGLAGALADHEGWDSVRTRSHYTCECPSVVYGLPTRLRFTHEGIRKRASWWWWNDNARLNFAQFAKIIRRMVARQEKQNA